MDFLPVSRDDMNDRGWKQLDIILVSGDAYVDHPAWAAALLGRYLEHHGYKVGVIAQPDWKSTVDFVRLGAPRLFFGVSAGNLDSMVNHYTADKKRRRQDVYSPGAKAGLRPDRATIVYTNRLHEAFPGVPVIIGGVEASMRRLAHYDYWSDQVRRSMLLDSKAELLIYGMGEKSLLESAQILAQGCGRQALHRVRGSCYVAAVPPEEALILPSYEEAASDPVKFSQLTKMIMQNSNPYLAPALAQQHGDRWVIVNPPVYPLKSAEMDEIYDLPYQRLSHPVYESQGGVPALQSVRFSILTHRGCFGGCHFCSIGLHQGKFIQNRSQDSLLAEARSFSRHPDFKGSVLDVGGPSANMYGLAGKETKRCQRCKRTSCLIPAPCPKLDTDHSPSVRLWRQMRQIKGLKNIRVASGVRYDLILQDTSGSYLYELCKHHVGGQLKVAPEHVAEKVTALMGKPDHTAYLKFVESFARVNRQLGKEQYLIPYLISAHPGCGLAESRELASYVGRHMRHKPEQVQNFTPLPMTVSTSMYYTGLNPFTLEKVYVPRSAQERRQQRDLLQGPSGKKQKDDEARLHKHRRVKPSPPSQKAAPCQVSAHKDKFRRGGN
jgi:uncharacterized radical SAM protein YgiQ